MLEKLLKLGVPGSVGVLVGIGLVSWIEPTTSGGVALLIAIPVLIGVAIGGVGSFVGRRRGREEE